MPRTLAYWEKKRAEADKRLRGLHPQLHAKPSGAPRRRARDSEGKLHVRVHSNWARHYVRWKTWNADRRALFQLAAKLRQRIAYYDERIRALRARNAWHAVRQGVL